MGFLSGISCLFCNSLNGCMKVSLLPIVEMWEGWNSLSVNLHNKQVFPTPESPRSKSLNSTSYCLAMVSYGHNSRNSASGFHVYPLHSIIFSPFPSTAPRLRVDRPNNCPDKRAVMRAEMIQERWSGGCGGLVCAPYSFRWHPSHLMKWVEITELKHHAFEIKNLPNFNSRFCEWNAY